MKILICYHSQSGNTEKMAEAIAEGAKNAGAEIELKEVQEADPSAIKEYQAVILGSPAHFGMPSAEIKEFIDETISDFGNLDGMVGGAFSSGRDISGNNQCVVMSLLASLLIHGMIVQGSSGENHTGVVCFNEPDEEDLRRCREYGKRMAGLCRKVSTASP